MNRRSWIGHIATAIGSVFAGNAFASSNPVRIADPAPSVTMFVPVTTGGTGAPSTFDKMLTWLVRSQEQNRINFLIYDLAAAHSDKSLQCTPEEMNQVIDILKLKASDPFMAKVFESYRKQAVDLAALTCARNPKEPA